jgi:hypothetical protein
MPERHENEFEEDYDSRFEEFGMDDEYDEKKPFSEEDDDDEDDDYSYPIDEDDDFLDDEDEIDWDSFDFEDD